MLIRQFFAWLISLLPSFDTPESVLNTFNDISSVAGFVNYYLPVGAMVTAITSFISVSAICFVVSTILKLF